MDWRSNITPKKTAFAKSCGYSSYEEMAADAERQRHPSVIAANHREEVAKGAAERAEFEKRNASPRRPGEAQLEAMIVKRMDATGENEGAATLAVLETRAGAAAYAKMRQAERSGVTETQDLYDRAQVVFAENRRPGETIGACLLRIAETDKEVRQLVADLSASDA